MPTKKIADIPLSQQCRHPDHNPPSHMVLEDGIYEHTCAGCGHRQRFLVSKPTFVACGNLAANPTTLGDVWVGEVRVAAETIEKFGGWPTH